MTQNIALPGVGDEVNDTIARLVKQLDSVAVRNARLDAYYGGEKNLRKIHGGVVPEQYYRLGLTLGWSAKGVDALARRCNLDGLVWSDGTLDDYGYREVWDGNELASEVDQGITSALIHGLAFVAASRGDGETTGLVHFYSASDATGERNVVTRQLDNLLVVRERDKSRNITALTLYLPGRTIAAASTEGKWEILDDTTHQYGVPAAALRYTPRLNQRMGRSRLTRAARGHQDAAARELVRLEGHMDVYSFPEFWMLGADPSVFKDEAGNPLPVWRQMLGRIKGIPDDQDMVDKELPTLARADVKKFDASSPAPHLAAVNMYAKLCARELSLPDAALAITDFANPTSADAYDASQRELIDDAEVALTGFSVGLQRVVRIALAMQAGEETVPDAFRTIECEWRDPRYTSKAAQADAGSKAIAAVPWLAETETGLRLLGLTPQQVETALAERRRAQAGARLDSLITAARGVTEAAPNGQPV